MSGHSSLPHDSRKKTIEHPTRDGAAGMGSTTKRHFGDVKARMARYAEEQDELEYDQSQNYDHDDFRDGSHKSIHPSEKTRHKSGSDAIRHEHGQSKGFSSPNPHRHHRSLQDPNIKGMERIPVDGLTGMGPQTQRHFSEVKARMEKYRDDRDSHEYDRERAHQSHSPGLLTRIGRVFGDEKGIQTRGSPNPSTHTPTTARKRNDHLNLATPQAIRRQRKPASLSDLK